MTVTYSKSVPNLLLKHRNKEIVCIENCAQYIYHYINAYFDK